MLTSPPQTGTVRWSAMCLHILQTQLLSILFALILNYFSKIREYAEKVDEGGWVNYKLFSYFGIPTYELAGKTIGIVGYGDIGKKVAEIARAFGMKVITFTRSPQKITDGTPAVSLEELLKTSDIVTLHCPLTKDNEKMINAESLGMMKKSAFFRQHCKGRSCGRKGSCTGS